jgi:hypothetical protein
MVLMQLQTQEYGGHVESPPGEINSDTHPERVFHSELDPMGLILE